MSSNAYEKLHPEAAIDKYRQSSAAAPTGGFGDFPWRCQYNFDLNKGAK
jgi:hypothetical protein